MNCRVGRPVGKDTALTWGDLARTRVREKSAEAIVVMRPGESSEERRAEGVSARLKENSQRKRATTLEPTGRDNIGRYPGGRRRPRVKPGRPSRAGCEWRLWRKTGKKACTKVAT